MKDITKRYQKDDLTIVWQPAKCIHAGECVKALPNVYKPKEKPWITPENATIEELKAQIDKCPSGALSYEMAGAEVKTETSAVTSIQVAPNGPLLCKGTVEVKKVDGTTEIHEKMTAFCRCGASSNKPYCDGAHAKIGFEG
ncbi:MAG: (4Fe-4S)-binding protein [Bacteroidia bacterium]|nr:(4Fe-4S)-binding protein [Bacteroidia bacterium]